jgi:hypothetical protein
MLLSEELVNVNKILDWMAQVCDRYGTSYRLELIVIQFIANFYVHITNSFILIIMRREP